MTVAIRQVDVVRPHRYVVQGQSVDIGAQIVDYNGLLTTLVTPSGEPFISIYDPEETRVVNEQPMTVVSTGIYRYTYDTNMSNEIGIYTANISVVHDSNGARLERVPVFNLYRASVFGTVTYLPIKDQTGVTWYWYIDEAGQLVASATVPSFMLKQVSALASVIPYWLEISNPTPALRYIYPSIAGEATVVSSPPAVGSGTATVMNFVNYYGDTYNLGLDIADQITITEV